MSVDFQASNTTRYYQRATTLTLPDDDWCMGVWMHADELLSASYQYLLSNGSFGSNDTFHVFVVDTNNVGDAGPGDLRATAKDGAGVDRLLDSTSNFNFTDDSGLNADVLAVFQRRGLNLEIIGCVKDGTAVSQSLSVGTFGTVSVGTVTIGGRGDLNTSRFYWEELGEAFILTGDSLTIAQIEELAEGHKRAGDLAGITDDAHWSLIDADDTADISGNGLTLTKNGTAADGAADFIVGTGTGVTTAPSQTGTGAGTSTVTGTGATTAPAQVGTGQGTATITGTGATLAPAQTGSGLGTSVVTGVGATSAPAQIGTGQGTATVTGTGSTTAPAQTGTGTGMGGPVEAATVQLFNMRAEFNEIYNMTASFNEIYEMRAKFDETHEIRARFG